MSALYPEEREQNSCDLWTPSRCPREQCAWLASRQSTEAVLQGKGSGKALWER